MSYNSVLNVKEKFAPSMNCTDIMLGFSYLASITGIARLISTILHGSSRIVNHGNTFTPESFFNIVEQFKVTYTLITPFDTKRLLNHPQIKTADLNSLRIYICGSCSVSFDVIKKMNIVLKNGKFCHCYGMTEMVAFASINLNHTENNCVGQLFSGFQAKIVNERGERLGIDETGELCIKEPFLFCGYLGAEKDDQSHFDNEGFFLTGDIAQFDENGDLFIIDRKKAIFKSCEYTITPTEIETFLDKIDGVKQSCVVPIPDPICDNIPAVVIEKSENSTCIEASIYDAVLSEIFYY